MDSNKIKALLVGVFAMFAAIYLGIAAATAQFEAVGWILGTLALVTGIALGRKIFLVIPLLSSMALILPLPGNFDSAFISYVIFLGFSSTLFLMRRLPMWGGFSELEFWSGLLVLSVLQAYLRNPVGLNIFGAGDVGAKPYAIFLITAVTAFVLSVLVVDLKELRIWVRLSFLGSILNFAIGAFSWLVPSIGMYLGASFSTDVSQSQEGQYAGRATRISFVRHVAIALATWISSKISPLRASFHPLWLPLILIAFAFAAMSGFRSQLILVGLIFFIGTCYRGGFASVVVSSILAALLVLLLAFANAVAPLPANVQRALTFLPGTWDQRYEDDAENSTEWRVIMWKQALLTDRWITNKLLGDGMGFTRYELERMKDFGDVEKGNQIGTSGLTLQQESFMISGGYHSGPVQTVRTTGYVGLAILLLAMIRLAMHAHRIIRAYSGTEWHWVALFISIPLIALPIFWTLVFGTFTSGSSAVLMGSALIRLLQKNLPALARQQSQENLRQTTITERQATA